MAKRTLKQIEAWKRNWGLYLLSGFSYQLRNYKLQTNSSKLFELEVEIERIRIKLKEGGE